MARQSYSKEVKARVALNNLAASSTVTMSGRRLARGGLIRSTCSQGFLSYCQKWCLTR